MEIVGMSSDKDDNSASLHEVIGLYLQNNQNGQPELRFTKASSADDQSSMATLNSTALTLTPDAIQSLVASSIKIEDGSTVFLHALANDTGNYLPKLLDGQTLQLIQDDGTTAFVQNPTQIHAVHLQDGTITYLSTSSQECLFDGDTLELEQLASTQDSNAESSILTVDNLVPPTIITATPTPETTSSRAQALGDKAFKCTYENCGRLYTTQHHLKVHERSHTGDRPFKCTSEGCGKAFSTGYGLKSHTRVHTGETPYRCSDKNCKKAFKTSGDLQKHIRIHTGERPFKCTFKGCDRAFTTSNIRKVHIRTHTGERPYICNYDSCGRAFASATNYKNHIRIHTGEKPYLCPVQGCGKRFTEYSSLYKHHVVHTHAKPYICTICGKNYRQTSTLALHMRGTHGIVDSTEDEVPEGEEPEEEFNEEEKDGSNIKLDFFEDKETMSLEGAQMSMINAEGTLVAFQTEASLDPPSASGQHILMAAFQHFADNLGTTESEAPQLLSEENIPQQNQQSASC